MRGPSFETPPPAAPQDEDEDCCEADAMDVWLYIVLCADGSYYTGTTRGTLEARIAQHNAGHFGGYTATRRPVRLVFSQPFQRITDAIAAERQVKGWSRPKKEALVNGAFDLLPMLARRRQPFPERTATSPTSS